MCIKPQQHGQRAFTLVELMMAIAVSGVILTALISFTIYAARSFVGMHNYVDLEQKSQNALDTLTKDIRQTQWLSNFTKRIVNGQTVTNSLEFIDYDNHVLTFKYVGNMLVREKQGVSTMLLTNVDYLTFLTFQRNPIGGTDSQFRSTNGPTVKLVSVSWVCSRTILGARQNTESVQTAKIVIRKSREN
jgi:prepilin-type N-terminal cleavage/methylation domain-containing protein